MSPLQLKTHSFPLVIVRANENGKTTGICGVNQQVSCVPVPGVPNHWNVQLRLDIHSIDPNNPFCYESEIFAIGVVEVTGDYTPEKREQIAAVNGLGILYSACREMLLNITARSVYGPYSIPSLNFSKVLQEANENLPAGKSEPKAIKA